MIPKRDLQQLRAEWTLDIGVIEKDYVLGWLLAAIAQHPALPERWIFKGGTCLRKCYYETFRFSEDLDFTVMQGGPDEPDDLRRIFGEIAEWLLEESGIELTLDNQSFQRRRNRRGKPTTQGRIAYQGPNPQPTSPKVKLDITTDEVLVEDPSCDPSDTRTAMRLFQRKPSCAIRSPNCSGRSCEHWRNAAGRVISTTWSTCIATQISSAGAKR